MLGVEIQVVQVPPGEELDVALTSVSGTGAQAVDILPSPKMRLNARKIAAWALQGRLPSIYWAKDFPAAGGLNVLRTRFRFHRSAISMRQKS